MINQSSANNYATKSDVNKIVKQSEKVLRQEILRVEERVENVETRLSRVETKVNSIDNKLDRIAVTLDGFVGRVDNLTTDNEVGANQIHELQKNMEDHGKRIKILESS